MEEANRAMQSIAEALGSPNLTTQIGSLNKELRQLGLIEDEECEVIDEDLHPFYSAYLSFEIDCYNFWNPIGQAARSFWFRP